MITIYDFAYNGDGHQASLINWRKYKKFKRLKLLYEFDMNIITSFEGGSVWKDVFVRSEDDVKSCINNNALYVVTRRKYKKYYTPPENQLMFTKDFENIDRYEITKYKPCRIFRDKSCLTKFILSL